MDKLAYDNPRNNSNYARLDAPYILNRINLYLVVYLFFGKFFNYLTLNIHLAVFAEREILLVAEKPATNLASSSISRKNLSHYLLCFGNKDSYCVRYLAKLLYILGKTV